MLLCFKMLIGCHGAIRIFRTNSEQILVYSYFGKIGGYIVPQGIEGFFNAMNKALFMDWGSRGRRFKSCHSDHAKPFFRWKERLFCNLFDVFKILKTALKSKLKQNGCLSKHREASVLQFQLFNRKL